MSNKPETNLSASELAPVFRALEREEELVLPFHKRTVTQYSTNEYGVTELRLFYGDKEISFDEPDLFEFGETLVGQPRFVADEATTWGNGYEWPRVQGLLEQLIEEGVLQRAEDSEEQAGAQRHEAERTNPLPPALTLVPRTWLECEDITRELAARPLELGYLELVIPIFRVAHMSLDADGRQVGEANVFPSALRLDIPTRWRTCIYSGSRYLSDRPMNVTALKSMRAHWGQMMVMLSTVRDSFLNRFPKAREGWTVGDLERLSTVVLALPSYALMRSVGRVENGALHPALSSLFRVTDGLRMTVHQMLFVPFGEPALAADTPITSQQVFDYAERNNSLHSEHGVCAGPSAMIKEFLAVLVDGKPARDGPPAELDAAVSAALSDREIAMDYGLYGLQAYAAVFSLWPIMTRAYERLARIAEHWASQPGVDPSVIRLREYLHEHIYSMMSSTLLVQESWRVDREKVYVDMYAKCAAGLRDANVLVPLNVQIAPSRLPRQKQAEEQMRTILQRHFACAESAHVEPFEEMLSCLIDYMSQEQAILGVACKSQRHINALLGRSPPKRAFTARDIDIHLQIQGAEARKTRLPYLGDQLEAIFGIRVSIDKDRIDISDAVQVPSTVPHTDLN